MSQDLNKMMDVVTPFLESKNLGGAHTINTGTVSLQETFRQTHQQLGNKKPSNSTSTIYANSTISHPNESEVLQSVASVLHCIMLQVGVTPSTHDGLCAAPEIDPKIAVFDERTYTKSGETRKRLRWGFNRAPTASLDDSNNNGGKRLVPDEGVPPATEIYYFLMACSQRASFSSECSIIALVLLNRLLTSQLKMLTLHAFNWRLFFLTSLLVAQKIWEDVALANVDFPIIWRHAVQVEDDGTLDVKAFNLMEAKFLELLSFNVYVSTSLYGQFCFELRTIHNTNTKQQTGSNVFPLYPLTPLQAAKLEASTSVHPDVLKSHVTKRLSKSASGLMVGKAGQYVLS